MRILNTEMEEKIQDRIANPISQRECDLGIRNILDILDGLHANIPDNRRGSYGIVYALKVLSEYLYSRLAEIDAQARPRERLVIY